MSLTVFYGFCRFPIVSPVPWNFYISLTVSYIVAGCLTLSFWSHALAASLSLSSMFAALTVSYCLSGSMELQHVSHGCLLFVTVPPIAMKMLHVSHCLLLLLHWLFSTCLSLSPILSQYVSYILSLSPMLLLAFSYFLSGPEELLHVSYCLLWLLVVSHGLFWFVSYIVACCLSCLVPQSCSMSLNVSYGCWLSLILPYGYWLSLTVFFMVAGCLSLSPMFFLAVSLCLAGPIELLHVSN